MHIPWGQGSSDLMMLWHIGGSSNINKRWMKKRDHLVLSHPEMGGSQTQNRALQALWELSFEGRSGALRLLGSSRANLNRPGNWERVESAATCGFVQGDGGQEARDQVPSKPFSLELLCLASTLVDSLLTDVFSMFCFLFKGTSSF